MPLPIIYINGLFWTLDKAKVSILDRGFSYGDGLFETLRAYSNKIFRLEEHLDRLIKSAHLIFLELPMTRNEIRSAIYSTIDINGLSDSIIRITVTRGEQNPGMNIDNELSPTVVIQARPTTPLSNKAYKKGVPISLFKDSASRITGVDEQIKSCNYLSQVLIRERALKDGSFEGVMLDYNNNISEGTTSNIFIIKRNELKTPAVNEFVLPGITRQAVLDIALENKIIYKEERLNEVDIYEADEVFITNTGIEILPVCSVNGQKVGNGKPGPITKSLHRLFLNFFEDSL